MVIKNLRWIHLLANWAQIQICVGDLIQSKQDYNQKIYVQINNEQIVF